MSVLYTKKKTKHCPEVTISREDLMRLRLKDEVTNGVRYTFLIALKGDTVSIESKGSNGDINSIFLSTTAFSRLIGTGLTRSVYALEDIKRIRDIKQTLMRRKEQHHSEYLWLSESFHQGRRDH